MDLPLGGEIPKEELLPIYLIGMKVLGVVEQPPPNGEVISESM